MKSNTTIQTLLLQTLLFLIPSNLAYHFDLPAAYINGRLSDYLLPKLYLSDIPLLLLDLIFVFNLIKLKRYKLPLLVFIIFTYLFLISLTSISPVSSTWFVAKLVSYVLFISYLIHHYSRSTFLKLAWSPLLIGFLLQVFLCLFQYINHSSFIGYIFFGEPNLSSPDISRASIGGELVPYPYGTTPHPNVLAGYLGVVGLILASSPVWAHIVSNSIVKKAVSLFAISLLFGLISLTGSLSALSGLSIALIAILATNLISRQCPNVLVLMYTTITQAFSMLFYPVVQHTKLLTDNPSFSTRYELNSLAYELIRTHPLTGIGPNLFSYYSGFKLIPGQVSYTLQPVHHGLLLILSETGFIGLILAFICLYKLWPIINRAKPPISAFLPLICLTTILIFDHYPLTLQTGQLLLLFSFAIILLPSKAKNRT